MRLPTTDSDQPKGDVTVNLQLNLDTADELSSKDLLILRALLNGASEDNIHAQAAPAPAAKKATAPAAAKTPAKSEPVEEPEATEESSDDGLLDTAVARATELVASGKASVVKAALSGVGAKRVSELTGKNIPDFLAALDV